MPIGCLANRRIARKKLPTWGGLQWVRDWIELDPADMILRPFVLGDEIIRTMDHGPIVI